MLAVASRQLLNGIVEHVSIIGVLGTQGVFISRLFLGVGWGIEILLENEQL
jgi:hypothetical protein